eukprot:m.83839 g.83839  ORF g.83839 m.83839 type:complete len:58 (+) comp25677_c0_seq1:63-236(+)
MLKELFVSETSFACSPDTNGFSVAQNMKVISSFVAILQKLNFAKTRFSELCEKSKLR